MNGPLSRLIGVCGKARHGKGEVSALLVERGFHEVQFSAPVKELLLHMDPLVMEVQGGVGVTERLSAYVERRGMDSAKAIPEVRRLLQGLGNGAREIVSPSTWVNGFRWRWSDVLDEGLKMVVSDMRYPNEAQLIRELGGEVWKVRRGGWTEMDDGSQLWNDFDNGLGELNENPSETAVDEINADLTILNDGSLADLRYKLRQYLVRRAFS